MGNAIWKGAIDFALVHIPVAIHSAENNEEEIQLRLLDGRDQARVRYTRINEETGKEVEWDEVVKGYEFEPGRYVVITEEDFDAAAARANQSIEIESFVELSEIQRPLIEKPYFLVPLKGGEKGYVLLHRVLTKTKRAAVARFVLRSKERLAVVVANEQSLTLLVLRYASQLKSSEEAGVSTNIFSEIKPSPRELAVAEQLVAQMTEEWKADRYKDRFQDALRSVIAERIKGQKPGRPKRRKGGKDAEVIDLVELLKKSLKTPAKKRA